jgi:hypothetical protein
MIRASGRPTLPLAPSARHADHARVTFDPCSIHGDGTYVASLTSTPTQRVGSPACCPPRPHSRTDAPTGGLGGDL